MILHTLFSQSDPPTLGSLWELNTDQTWLEGWSREQTNPEASYQGKALELRSFWRIE